ncbi:MAG TPA: hypothetical protein VGQ34_02270 [Sphingomicrobium sp.]|jgi:hypothetical protein|nr:hypothetical protein [Sphingomicrobium sp.]
MTKPASLDRLRDISKQRSIRRLPIIRPDDDRPKGEGEIQMARIEWPVPGSDHF